MKTYRVLAFWLVNALLVGGVHLHNHAHAQQRKKHTFNLGMNVTVAHPLDEMRTYMPTSWGGGLGLHLLGRPSAEWPLQIGLDFNYTRYGSERWREPGDFFGESLDETINSNILMLHAVARLSPLDGHTAIRPYMEGLLGTKMFFTRWRYQSRVGASTTTLESNFDEADLAFSYGVGLGVNIDLGEHISLDLRCAYLLGTRASYVESVGIDDEGFLFYNTHRSHTDMLVPQLGLAFIF